MPPLKAQNVAIPGDGVVKVLYRQCDVIDLADLKHGLLLGAYGTALRYFSASANSWFRLPMNSVPCAGTAVM